MGYKYITTPLRIAVLLLLISIGLLVVSLSIFGTIEGAYAIVLMLPLTISIFATFYASFTQKHTNPSQVAIKKMCNYLDKQYKINFYVEPNFRDECIKELRKVVSELIQEKARYKNLIIEFPEVLQKTTEIKNCSDSKRMLELAINNINENTLKPRIK